MSAIRRAASRLLNAVVAHSSAETREWGRAMLREMDCVEGDWAALLWALGSTTALCRHSVSQQLKRPADGQSHAASALKDVGKRMAAVLFGIVVAGTVLTICVLALSSLLHASWFEPARAKLAERLLIVVVPEAVYVVIVLALWRQRRPLALGILAAGITLITHALVHFVNHG